MSLGLKPIDEFTEAELVEFETIVNQHGGEVAFNGMKRMLQAYKPKTWGELAPKLEHLVKKAMLESSALPPLHQFFSRLGTNGAVPVKDSVIELEAAVDVKAAVSVEPAKVVEPVKKAEVKKKKKKVDKGGAVDTRERKDKWAVSSLERKQLDEPKVDIKAILDVAGPIDGYEKLAIEMAKKKQTFPTDFIREDGTIDWGASNIFGLGPYNQERLLFKMCIDGHPTYEKLLGLCLETPLTRKRVDTWIQRAMIPDPTTLPPGAGKLDRDAKKGTYHIKWGGVESRKELEGFNGRIREKMAEG